MPASIETRSPSMLVECVSAARLRSCASSTITCCASAEKPMKVGSEKWLVPPNFRKSGPLSRYASIACRSSCRRHRHQLFAAALGDEIVHLLLEQRQLPHHAAERERVRPAPAEDVAGGEDPRAGLLAARDPIADPGQRQQRAVAVAHGRDAVAQIDLRRLEHDVVLPRLILGHRLVAIVLAAVERQVHVGVDQARHDPASARVDLPRVRGNRHGAARSDRGDARAVDQRRPRRRSARRRCRRSPCRRRSRCAPAGGACALAWSTARSAPPAISNPSVERSRDHFFVASGRSSRLPHSSHAP